MLNGNAGNVEELSQYQRTRDAMSRPVATSAADLAAELLTERKWWIDGTFHLRAWRGDFYRFTGTHYRTISPHDMEAEVMSWLQSKESVRERAGVRLRNDVIANLKGMVSVGADTQPPCWLRGGDDLSAKMSINLQNGVLDLESAILGHPKIHDHSPELFVRGCLPYKFKPSAQCLIWQSFLEKSIPDSEVRSFLQEWFGYNLTYDTHWHKFVLHLGEGANGKSVSATVLRELLGTENVSSVGLEAFNPNRTFILATTDGKLANIAEELNEVDKLAEGMLKQYVGGSPIPVERKHRDPYDMVPTAKLSFLSNVLPRFSDRTDGLWRRLFVVPWVVQILDETKQDRRLVDPHFWRSSGELSGIFNWALEGLVRLTARGYFVEPQACLKAKGEFKRDANPARTFLLDYCEFSEDSQVAVSDLHQAYVAEIERAGQRPLGESQFAREIPRVFPRATKSQNVVRLAGGIRSHVWTGIAFRDCAARLSQMSQ